MAGQGILPLFAESGHTGGAMMPGLSKRKEKILSQVIPFPGPHPNQFFFTGDGPLGMTPRIPPWWPFASPL